MARITKNDLIGLSQNEIRQFFNRVDQNSFHLSPIKEFLEGQSNTKSIGNKNLRISNLLTEIVMGRFLNNKPDNLVNEITDLIENEVYLRQIPFGDGDEKDPDSITEAAEAIVKHLETKNLI